MSSFNYENQILDAIETMVDKAIENAGYDKTIQGIIVSIEDAAQGKYKVKYQNGEIEAFSNNIDLIYPAGTMVNVLVPNGDFTQNKTILDAIEKDKIKYGTVFEESEMYDNKSGNCIAAPQVLGLNSYKTKDTVMLYDRDNDVNIIGLDVITFEENIKDNNSILCGASFKTELVKDQQRQGNYGIAFDLDFTDNLSGDTLTKSYIIDVNQMTGNPYDFNEFNRQYKVFNINSENFISIKQIYLFSEGFPNIDDEKVGNDIFVNNYELSIVRKLTEEELNGYLLNLVREGKGYFDKEDSEDAKIFLNAILKQRNIEITNGLEYYWFKENIDITIDSADFVTYGGNGWQCLNDYNVIDEETNERMYLTNIGSFEITKADVVSKSVKIKCVIVKDNEVLAEMVAEIFNYDSDYDLSIVSDSGDQFYYDNGRPSLTCLVNGEENSLFNYQWSYADNNGVIYNLEETPEENEEYNAAVADYELLVAELESEIAMPAASQERLDELKATIDKYDDIQRVEGNKVFKIDLTKIDEYATFKCLVKFENIEIGTAEFTIKNSLFVEGTYTLTLYNGIQTYSYDTMGISPASSSLEKPIEILPLTFDIKDNLGNTLSGRALDSCEITWDIPTENTMLVVNNYDKEKLEYSILDKYNKAYINNTIRLNAKYKEISLDAATAFTFVKDGEPGTNGTGVSCKIVPNIEGDFIGYPMLVNGNLNYTPLSTNKWFKVQLWENGEKIFEGTDSDEEHNITWSVLKNSYARQDGTKVSDPSNIAVNNGEFAYTGYNADAASIVKVQVDYDGTTYYCTLPVLVSEVSDDYQIELKADSGFTYVMYANDGKRPQYDNTNPFTIVVKKTINGFVEDISLVNNQYKVSYNWAVKGKIFSPEADDFIIDLHLTIDENAELAGNQKILIPNEDYNGENITNALEVKILDANLAEKGKLLIPIHFYLDRYGLADLNGWDGNRIALNDDTGSILAPQVGAGKKESDNTFSGVLMGSVKERGQDKTEQGLFGYNHGRRSIFLDSDTGKAEFGFDGRGQITIDPTEDTARIYGGNYKNNHQTGMLIDLTTPEIKWGNNNFSVDRDGHLIAKGGGTIGGWNIWDDKLTAGNIFLNANGSLSGGETNSQWSISTAGKATFNNAEIKGTIYATAGKIAGYDIYGNTLKGYNVGMCGMSGEEWAFWAGSGAGSSAPFRVGHTGELYATNADITGSITTSNLSCTGGYIHLSTGGGYLNIGGGYTHPEVSGLNVSGYNTGINIWHAGISMDGDCMAYGGFKIHNGEMGRGIGTDANPIKIQCTNYKIIIKGGIIVGYE